MGAALGQPPGRPLDQQGFEDLLRAAGLRVTRPRVAVLSTVQDHPHADSATIFDLVRAGLLAVSRQAVYDCLNAFADTRILRRIEPAGSAVRYELRVGDNHHHLVCRSCGAVVDVDCAVGAAPCLEPVESHGFSIDEAEVIYWGRCPSCASPDSAGDLTAPRSGRKESS